MRNESKAGSGEAALGVEDILALADEHLSKRIVEAQGRVSPRAARFAQERAAGATIVEAARRAELSTKGGAPYRLATSPGVSELVKLLREQARRACSETVEGAAAFLGDVAARALLASDYGSAVRAKSEQAKLLGLYPETRIRLGVERLESAEVSPEEWEALARLRHEVRKQVTPASAAIVDAEVMPADEAAHPGPPLPDSVGSHPAHSPSSLTDRNHPQPQARTLSSEASAPARRDHGP